MSFNLHPYNMEAHNLQRLVANFRSAPDIDTAFPIPRSSIGTAEILVEAFEHGTKITDAGLDLLKGLGSLEILDVGETAVGDAGLAIRFADRLLDEGVWATSVVFPTVALDGARLRTIVTAAHSDDELDSCLAAFGRVGRELGVVAG